KDQEGGEWMRYVAENTKKGNGEGFKASLGSRAIRFEYVLWFKNAEFASELYKASKTNEIHKAIDDSSLDPPKWWKDFSQRGLGNKKVAGELMMNLSTKSSGDIFIVKAECETIVLLEAMNAMIQKMTNQSSFGGGGGGGSGRPMPQGAGGNGPGGKMPMPGPMQ
ncbi:MAG TPA: hypothetical protein VGI99_04870, partial [Gemmataceae bacterium]